MTGKNNMITHKVDQFLIVVVQWHQRKKFVSTWG